MENIKLNCQKICLVVLMFITASAFSCCKDDDNDQEYIMSNQDFVTSASSSNSFEVAAGGLAVSKAQNAEVKHYGEHMVNDHTAAGLEMKNLASQKGWIVPDALQQKEQQNMTKLMSLNGTAFDQEFVNIMVQSHQDAVALFETGANPMGLADADLRAMATAKLPTLKSHLQAAIDLKTRVNP